MAVTTVDQDRDRRRARSARHAARRVLWDESGLPRVKGCAQLGVLAGGDVAVKATGSGAERRAGFSGLAVCGSVWSCPVCSAKIQAHRQQQLAAAILAWETLGGSVYMLTLTMRHRQGQSLKRLWDGLSKAWAATTQGRPWRRESVAYGVAGWARVVEVTHGDNGWHVHVHALLFVDESALLPGMSALDLGPTMFQRWRDSLVRQGFRAPAAAHGGLDIRKGGSGLAGYFAKNTYHSAEELRAAHIGRTAWEVAGGSGKAARGRNRTPFQILADVVEVGDADDLDLWHEWERGSKDRRQLTWSKGLRHQLLGDDADLTDEEVAEADDLAGDVLAVIPLAAWRSTWRWQTARLLDAAEQDDTGHALRELLAGAAPPG